MSSESTQIHTYKLPSANTLEGWCTLARLCPMKNELCALQLCVSFQLKQREYSQDQIGGLDYEELSGRVTYGSDLCQQAVQEFESSQNVV